MFGSGTETQHSAPFSCLGYSEGNTPRISIEGFKSTAATSTARPEGALRFPLQSVCPFLVALSAELPPLGSASDMLAWRIGLACPPAGVGSFNHRAEELGRVKG